MHEMALAQGMLDIIQSAAVRERFSRVSRIVVEVGPFSCVDAHALEFGFQAAAKRSCAEGAALDIVRPSGRADCFGCGQTVVLEQRGDPCPNCGSHQLVVTGGDELTIKEMEVA